MVIRKAKEEDIAAFKQIVHENYADYPVDVAKYFEQNIRSLYANSLDFTFLVIEDPATQEIVSFGGYTESYISPNIYEIIWINVRKDKQRHGYGTELMQHLLQHLETRKQTVSVLLTTSGERKIKFYENLQFSVISVQPDEKTVLMERKVK